MSSWKELEEKFNHRQLNGFPCDKLVEEMVSHLRRGTFYVVNGSQTTPKAKGNLHLYRPGEKAVSVSDAFFTMLAILKAGRNPDWS